MSEAKLPHTRPSDTAPYWDGIAAGRLMLKHCKSCGENHFYPRQMCPFCMSCDTEWLESSGRGIVYSYTTMRNGPAPAFVTLQEGPTLMSAIVDLEKGPIDIGQEVEVVFQPVKPGGPILPFFKRSV